MAAQAAAAAPVAEAGPLAPAASMVAAALVAAAAPARTLTTLMGATILVVESNARPRKDQRALMDRRCGGQRLRRMQRRPLVDRALQMPQATACLRRLAGERPLWLWERGQSTRNVPSLSCCNPRTPEQISEPGLFVNRKSAPMVAAMLLWLTGTTAP